MTWPDGYSSPTKKAAGTKKPACCGRRASAERVEPRLGVWPLGGVRGIARVADTRSPALGRASLSVTLSNDP